MPFGLADGRALTAIYVPVELQAILKLDWPGIAQHHVKALPVD